MKALLCPHCAAPLPPSVASRPFVTCAYCRTTSNAQGQVLEEHADLPEERDEPPEDEWERRVWEEERRTAQREAAWKAFQAELETAGVVGYQRLREATEKHLAALGQSEALARVVFAMARDFERDEGVTLDPIAFWRLADAYMKAVRALVKSPSYRLELPFFAASESGPLHYARDLDVASLQLLAAREPAPEKRSFWSKLLGR